MSPGEDLPTPGPGGAGAPGGGAVEPAGKGGPPPPAGPADVDLLAAALRAERADLEVYERVLAGSLADALPEGVVEVTRERSMADRLAKRPGRVTSLRARLGEHDLELHEDRHGLVGTVTRQVRGVAISRREVDLDEWIRVLAEQLASLAERSAAAREALGRLLGAEGSGGA